VGSIGGRQVLKKQNSLPFVKTKNVTIIASQKTPKTPHLFRFKEKPEPGSFKVTAGVATGLE
jgi:hypothetical protein